MTKRQRSQYRMSFECVTSGTRTRRDSRTGRKAARRSRWSRPRSPTSMRSTRGCRWVKRLGTIARSARVVGTRVPDADAKFPPLTRKDDVSVLQACRLSRRSVKLWKHLIKGTVERQSHVVQRSGRSTPRRSGARLQRASLATARHRGRGSVYALLGRGGASPLEHLNWTLTARHSQE